MTIKQKLLIFIINRLAPLLPYISARLTYQLWTRTYRYKMPEKEAAAFNRAHKQKIEVNGTAIMTYRWGEFNGGDAIKRPLILLLHGWNGRATQLCVFAQGLERAGFNVLAFDARGHGLSDGNHTNVMQTVAAIKKLSTMYGDFFAMIGHSFGAMCAVNSVNQAVVCEKLICISPPTDFLSLLQVFSGHLGLSKKAEMALEKYVLQKYGIDSFEQISITGIAPRMTIPLLIIHDKNDDRVPLSQGQKAVELWGSSVRGVGGNIDGSGAVLHVTQGYGHMRILRKPEVLKVSLGFLADETAGL